MIRADVPDELVCPFDYHRAPEPGTTPFEVLDGLRGRPIRWADAAANRGYWVLTRLEDIRYVFQHPELFSTYPLMDPETGGGWPRKLIPMELDPPDHGVYRGPISAWFSPRAAVAQETQIRDLARQLIDRVADRGSSEFLEDFAKPFPTTIFVEMLGLPAAETDLFVQWNTDLLHSQDGRKRHAAGGQIHLYLTDVIERRRRAPAEDLISVLLSSEVNGRPMNGDEVLDTCFLLFMAGLDTVTASLGFMFKFLAENEPHRRQLAENPELASAAVEELLRVHAVVNPTRTVIEDTELCGVPVRKGERILLSTALATRDPEAYGDALEVRFDRKPNNHIAFGAGPHRCLGSHLARKELAIALVEWHRRIPNYRLASEPAVKAHAGGVLGIDVLPLEWDV
jgi:cytochrome P450